MKRIILILSLVSSAYAGETKSYVELQRERIAAADAVYQRFRAEQDAAAQTAKDAAAQAIEDNQRRKAANKEHKRQLNLAAAAAPKVSVNVVDY